MPRSFTTASYKMPNQAEIHRIKSGIIPNGSSQSINATYRNQGSSLGNVYATNKYQLINNGMSNTVDSSLL